MSSARYIEQDFNIPEWAICRSASSWFNCLVSKFPVSCFAVTRGPKVEPRRAVPAGSETPT